MNDPADSTTIPVRPLSSLRGNEAVREWLHRALAEDRLPQAVLLTGPRGVGKRTWVRAVAAERFCEQGAACGRCVECRKLAHGHHPGFLSVAAEPGSRVLKIDQIRELSRTLHVAPVSPRGRVVSIEGAERMGTEAQDAFLKTLEEPPPGNSLWLCSERPDALLATIRSRCQRVSLAPLPTADLEAVVAELGLEPKLPLALAGGCPGRLAALTEAELPSLRAGVLAVLAESTGRSLAHWLLLLHQGLPAKAERDQVRSRALVLWELLSTLLRDLALLAAHDAPPTMLRNPDLHGELRALAGGDAYKDLGGLRLRLAAARQRIEGYVDPAAVLAAVVLPAEAGPRLLDPAMIAES